MTKLFICGVCGKPLIDGLADNCPFCGAHNCYLFESKSQQAKWRCSVCGREFDSPQDPCPICGAAKDKFSQADKGEDDKDLFDVELSEKDKALAQKALEVEVSNSTFYFCAAKKSDNLSERLLFEALANVEKEHAIIWQKFLRLPELPTANDSCDISSLDNLKESHRREDVAIKFYDEADDEAENEKVKLVFKALVEIETDHLNMSEERISTLQ